MTLKTVQTVGSLILHASNAILLAWMMVILSYGHVCRFFIFPIVYVWFNLQCSCVIPVNSETRVASRSATLPLALLMFHSSDSYFRLHKGSHVHIQGYDTLCGTDQPLWLGFHIIVRYQNIRTVFKLAYTANYSPKPIDPLHRTVCEFGSFHTREVGTPTGSYN